MQERSTASPSRAAREAFASYVARVADGNAPRFEDFCREHPALDEELRRLRDRIAGGGDMRSGGSIRDQIRETYGEGVDPGIALEEERSSASELPAAQGVGGRYRILGEVARGGQGAILRVRDADLHRDLAMKVVLGGPSAGGNAPSTHPRVVKRFLEEAQVTGQLDHPGIVPVHDLGLDGAGRVYFTMKLVRGEDLLAIFEKVKHGIDGWTRTRALGVILKVCEAMAYAHHKSVIHRDLKPANVMVGTFGAVYVMDWGLARTAGERDPRDLRVRSSEPSGPSSGGSSAPADESESPLVTMDGDIIGTPAYMPPEQARGDLKAMGPHSDVYAVGAMLYTLLTGQMPYVPAGSTMGAIDVWRAVTKGPPTPIHALASDVPLELQAVCEKAMAREPIDRYRDMNELAVDLRAFMENRVVAAYPTGAILEFRKWVQRNRGLAAACAGGLLALVVGLGVSLVLRTRAVRAETRAEEQALRAGQSAEEAQRISGFLVSLFQVVDPGEARGNTVTAREILDRGAERIDAELGHQPEVQSALMGTMGGVYKSLGLYDAAAPLFERALARRRQAFGDADPLVAESLNDLGEVLRFRAEYEAAEPLLREALEVRRAAFGEEHADVAETLHELAFTLSESGRYAEAEPLFRQALAMRRRLLGDHPAVAETLSELAFNLYYSGDVESPAAMLREALEIRREHLGVHPDVAESMNNLALYLYETGEGAEAEEMMFGALELKRRLLGDVHPEVAMGLNNLAFILHDKREYERAEEMYREALGVNRALLGDVHPNVAQARNNLAFVLNDQGDYEGARELFLSSLAILREVHGDEHPAVAGALETATTFLRAHVARLEESLGAEHPEYARARSELGELLARAEGYEEAQELLLSAYEVLRAEGRPSADATRETLVRIVDLYEALGQPELAEEYGELLDEMD